MSPSPGVRLDIDGHIATLTLDRPQARNAIDAEMHSLLLEALYRLRREDDVRAVLVRAEGPMFSAGGDLDFISTMQADWAIRTRACEDGKNIIHAFLELQVPIVVALHGDAIGLGASVALAGDIVVASKAARLADPHVKVGLVAGDGGVLFWPASVGMHRARRYLLTGDMLPAEEAYKFGLVTDLVETAAECEALARKLAEKVAGLAPIAVQGTKKALNALMKARANEAFDLSMAYEHQSAGSLDILEAVAAFREKRTPVFKNR